MRRHAPKLALLYAALTIAALCTPEPPRHVHALSSSTPAVIVDQTRRAEAWFAAAERARATTTTTTTPAREGMQGAQRTQQVAYYEPDSIEALICSVFVEDCDHAVRIATCESHLNPGARNPSGAAGLFQLLGHADLYAAHGWDAATDWSDPYRNTVVAHDLWLGSGWAPWVCR